jgi:Ca-activated chloride channel family protein
MLFLRPYLLPLTLLLPLLVGVGIALTVRRRRRVARRIGDPALVERLVGTDLHRAPWRRVALLLPAAAALGLAAADPRWGRERVEAGGGTEVALVLDASNSMRVEDLAPSRLERERDAARRLVRALPEGRFGIVAFAGRGYPLTPLTGDPGALELFLDALSPEIVTQGGSSLASAIRQGSDLLLGGDTTRARRLMVLMSDGEALEPEEEIRRAVERAAERGVVIHTLGIGTRQGGPVPDVNPASGKRQGYKRDPETGAPAVSRLDEARLREIAERTGGRYFWAGDPGAVEALARELRAGVASGKSAAAIYREGKGVRYPWFVGFALLLIALDTLLGADRARPRDTGS